MFKKKTQTKNEVKKTATNALVCKCGLPASIRSNDGTPFCSLACQTKAGK